MTAGRTAIEKIVARHCVDWTGDEPPRAGDFVTIRPTHTMTHDNTSAVLEKFRALAGPHAHVFDPRRLVFAMDHDIQNHTPENLAKYARIRAFAQDQGVRYEPPGRGIAHQVMIEEGYVRPGRLVVGADSHSNMYGALAALGTPVVRTDAAAIWATGQTWWIVPEQVRVVLTGSLRPGVTGKDVILALCAECNSGEVANCAVEFAGDGVASLSIDDRMTIANMTTEWGALAGWFPCDQRLERYLREQLSQTEPPERIQSDPDARFAREIRLDLDSVPPYVTGPDTVSTGRPAGAFAAEPVRIDKAYLMSCVNGRLSDLEAAAAVFGDDRAVAPGVRFYIAAASSRVEQAARASGVWDRLLRAGAQPLPPGCGACIGLGAGTLEPGEVGLSATNRNYQGRMGSRDATCYLASPAVVAESAIRGIIAAPGTDATTPRASVREIQSPPRRPRPQRLIQGFPPTLTGRALLLPTDHINTDGIYARDVTYRDDITFEEQGLHAMRNYDPNFVHTVREGDLLVAGESFGIGSSREQAATCLRSAGVRAIVGASVSQTYLRNAYNNGLIVLESRDLYRHLLHQSDTGDRRSVPGPELTIDFERSQIEADGRQFDFNPLSETAQRLIVAGGLAPMIAASLTPAVGGVA
ncbi:MAG: aconitase family protein [Phycisphaerales bacterium JB040]